MDHKSVVDKNETIYIAAETDDTVKAWKFTEADGIESLDDIELSDNGADYKGEATAPDADCYMLLKRSDGTNWIQIVRVGKPDPLVIGYTGVEGESHTYVQYNMDGDELSNGDMTEIVEGFYYAKPDPEETCYFQLDGGSVTITMTLPFPDDNKSKGKIVLQPNRYQMVAIPVKGVKVKEYFLDKIEDIIGDDANTVIDVVKAYPSSDVSDNKYMVFKPNLTNPDSSTNFELIQTDGDYTEITSFYVVTKDFTDDIVVPWDASDGDD